MPVVSTERAASPPATIPASFAPDLPFEQAAALVLGDLQHALLDLFAAAPTPIRKAADVERVFGVNHLMGWQAYRIATAQNPLAAGLHVPARVSLKKFLTAAARRRVPAEILARLTQAFDSFEQLVEIDAGGREELDAMLNAFLPEERSKQELASKEAVFKGMSHIKGLAAQAEVAAMFFKMNPSGERIDRVTLYSSFGLRRVRPEAALVLGSGDTRPLEKPILTLDGRSVDSPMGTLLPRFSSTPFPEFDRVRAGNHIDYVVSGREVGLRSAVDLVMAEKREGALPRYCMPGSPRFGGPAYTTTTPVKRVTLDAYVHEDVFDGAPPQLWVYDTACRGDVFPIDNPQRQHDRISTQDTIRALPAGLPGARLPHVPRYAEILEHIFSTVGWDASRFRAYRLDVQYPVHGAEYIMGFPLPDPPPAA